MDWRSARLVLEVVCTGHWRWPGESVPISDPRLRQLMAYWARTGDIYSNKSTSAKPCARGSEPSENRLGPSAPG